MCATTNNHSLITNACLLFVSRRLIIAGSVIAIGFTGRNVYCQARANEIYSESKRQFNVRKRDVSMNTNISGGPILKSVVSGLSLSLPPLVGVGSGLVCELVVRFFCCRIILTASSSGSLLINAHLPSVSHSYHLCLQVRRGQASLVRLGPLWWYWPIGYVSSFS